MTSRCASILFWLCGLLLVPTLAAAHLFAPDVVRVLEAAPEQYEVQFPDGAASRLRPPSACQLTETGAATVLRWDCRTGGLRGRSLSIAPSDNDTLVVVTMLDGTQTSALLQETGGSLRVPAEDRAQLPVRAAWARYLWLGVMHIASGVDHLLFVAALVLLLRGRRLVRTLTAFTVGHSLTLLVAGLSLVTLPPPPVEALIALSVVVVARELLSSDEETLSKRHPTLLAGGFGLLHGLGFAGALADVGLPAGQLPLSLLSFNAGVEVGQLAFVLLLLLPLAGIDQLARLRDGRLRLCAYPIGAFASALTIERVSALF